MVRGGGSFQSFPFLKFLKFENLTLTLVLEKVGDLSEQCETFENFLLLHQKESSFESLLRLLPIPLFFTKCKNPK